MNSIEKVSLIKFQERNEAFQGDHIFFVYSDGCASSIGRIGGAQELYLDSYCAYEQHVIIHELLHCLGFSHEHQRPDRERFITINMSVIPAQLRNQYTKIENRFLHPFEDLSMQYDIDSIMHYDSFSNDYYKKPIILTKNNQKIKVNTKMSPIDIAKINLLYPFSVHSLVKHNCESVKTISVPIFEKSFKDAPEWSTWSSYSECTVSCGLGIKLRTRTCRPVYNRSSSKIIECEGPSYDYETCHQRACGNQNTDDARSRQCDNHGRSMGKRLATVEVPSYSQNKCLLYCKEPNGKAFNTGVYVENGTPCSYDSVDDICILNECRQIGCDYRIGSKKKFNKCGICGGTDSQCLHVEKTKAVSSKAPQRMIPTKITIPAGAYNIKVEIERNSASKMFPAQICLKNGKNNVISREVLGTHEVLHDGVYWKLSNRHQTLNAKGPTTSNYHIVVFVRQAHQRIDVNYEYYTRPKYIWGGTPWKCMSGRGSATGTCYQTRKIKCVEQSRPKQQLDDSYCDLNKKPQAVTFECTHGCSPRG